MNYLVSQLFPVVVESDINNNEMWNGSLPYFIFIFFIMVIIGFTFRFIPETKGKSLEDLEKNWSKQNINEKTN
jgi:SP family xylose:H+ symportor-like MFS transporter